MTPASAITDDERSAFRDTLRRFVDRELMPHIDAWEEAAEFPRDLYLRAGELGLLGMGFPEEYGGNPGDSTTLIHLCEELARTGAGGLIAGLFSHGIGLPPIVNLGNDEQKRRYVPDVLAGRKVAAHAHGTLGIKEAVLAGVHSIEHGSVLDSETINLMKRRGTYLVPTVAVGAYVEEAANTGKLSPDSAAKAREIAPKMRASVVKAHKAGVKLAFGTDAGVFAHGTNAREFVILVGLGIPAMDVILAATRNAADLLGLRDLGQIKPGYIADLVVVDGDPLTDIHTLERPTLVLQSGAIVRDELPRPAP